jgi:AcrR family transcriptional regulator
VSPRQRTISDATILAATARMISRVGPVRLTLADVGGEVGLAPATLLQRFGSKRGLLLALVQQSVESVAESFERVRSTRGNALDAVIAAASEIAEHVRTPEELANNLAFFQIDLSDPDFHRLALEHSRRVRAGYQSLLDEAIAVGELQPCDTAALASALQAVAAGSLLNWAIHREGAVGRWVRADVETVIAPYRQAAASGPLRT